MLAGCAHAVFCNRELAGLDASPGMQTKSGCCVTLLDHHLLLGCIIAGDVVLSLGCMADGRWLELVRLMVSSLHFSPRCWVLHACVH
jgi:hypothetical protein